MWTSICTCCSSAHHTYAGDKLKSNVLYGDGKLKLSDEFVRAFEVWICRWIQTKRCCTAAGTRRRNGRKTQTETPSATQKSVIVWRSHTVPFASPIKRKVMQLCKYHVKTQFNHNRDGAEDPRTGNEKKEVKNYHFHSHNPQAEAL